GLRRLLMGAAAAEGAVELRTESWSALGTTAVLRYAGPADPAVRAAAQAQIDAIDVAASRFRDDSELTALNAARGGTTPVSELLLSAVSLAVRAAEISGGAVDPTLGESLVAAGYDRDWRELQAVPSGAPLSATDRIVVHRQRHALWRQIRLFTDPPAIGLPAGVTLDLGATAKALAADLAAEAAHAAGADGVLVSLGGDIATHGRPPAGGWLIRVTDDHRSAPDAEGQTISIQSGGLATSSIVTRRWLHDGQPMHHILDPRHGGPVQSPWRTVSVAAASCADANIASTAAIVLGAEAPEWLTAQGLPARLVGLAGDVRELGGWPS
ncbi:MAG: FAD:protein FMN transferase, partial [Solirubrobacteraceae bacterium]